MDLFLIFIGIIYLFVASVQDLRKREVLNWLSFSLIIFALAYRAFYSVTSHDFWFFIYGLAGLGVFIGLGYLFYYARVFAGGDAKLLMAMGAVLPGSELGSSLILSGIFIIFLLVAGSLWGLGFSGFLAFRNKKEFYLEFRKQLGKLRKLEYIAIGAAALLMLLILALGDLFLIILPIIVLAAPILYSYGRAVERACLIREVNSGELTVGDWLYESVKFRGRTIKPYWEGLSEDELGFLRKYRGKVKVKYGIPFVPAFFIAFILLILLGTNGLLI